MKIGIIGLAGAGKDTFANMLVKELDGFVIDRYAAPLKNLTANVFCLTLEQIEDRVLKEKPMQINRDRMIDAVFHCLVRVLKFNDKELDEASHLFFENFSSAAAISPRQFLQLLGTEVVRKVRRDAWRDRLQNRKVNCIVPDVRFENELCDFNILVERFTDVPRPAHESEHLAWDLQFTDTRYDYNLFVVNNHEPLSSLDTLKEQAIAIACLIKGKLLTLGA